MCDLRFAADPAQEAVPVDQVSSANHLAGQFLHADCPAKGVLTDVDAAGFGALNSLLHVHDVHIHNVIVHVNSSSNFVRIFQEAAELSAGFVRCYNS